jgi:hypothetical protein
VKKAVNALLILFVLLASVFALYGCTNAKALPSYALSDPKIEEAYSFARDNPEALNGVNCFCGCMQEIPEDDERLHTRGLIDCFLEPDGSWESHASNCSLCIDEALTVKSLVSMGKTKDEIKSAIDSEYKAASDVCSVGGVGTCGT